MKIYKFGGASVKDAEGIRNLVHVLRITGTKDVLLVISAMGKMTNAFERITNAYDNSTEMLSTYIEEVRRYHMNIMQQLFSKEHEVFDDVELFFMRMSGFMIQNKSRDYDYIYDQIVSTAELISTKIIHHYLVSQRIDNLWLDVRDLISTDSSFREAKVDWVQTEEKIKKQIQPKTLYITQGFIAKDSYENTTTLGREGSDYSAAILGYCLQAESVTIWKDVPGVLNADPRYFGDYQLLHQLSYTEAIELAFYGASVIHPKTLQPLQRKKIPLLVRSFLDPEKSGTAITASVFLDPKVPCFIVKKSQILLSISSLDFSFIVEQNISDIFAILHHYKMKVNLIQNSAISFSVCIEDKYQQLMKLTDELKAKFNVEISENVTLFTVRHFTENAVRHLESGKTVLLKQRTQETVQIVIQ